MPITLFDWLKNVTYNKKEWDSFSDEDKESFNSYMIHRYVSMYEPYIEISNMAQIIPLEDKQKTYNFYKSILPKNKTYFKYIKNNKKGNNSGLLEKISIYYKISKREANDYINIMGKKEIQNILEQMGVEQKEIKKLIK